MSQPVRIQSGTGVIADAGGEGYVIACGITVPANGAPGYAAACIFVDMAGGNVYTNTGTNQSCTFSTIGGGVSFPISVAHGGTGVATLASGKILQGAGTSAITATLGVGTGIAISSNNIVLTGAGTMDAAAITANSNFADSAGFVGVNTNDSFTTTFKPTATNSHADSGGSAYGPSSHANTGGKTEGTTTVAMLGALVAQSAVNCLAVNSAAFTTNAILLNTGNTVTQSYGDFSTGIGDGQGATAWISSDHSISVGTDCQAGPNVANLDQIGGGWVRRNSGAGIGTSRLIWFTAQLNSLQPQFQPNAQCILTFGTPIAATTLQGQRVTITDSIDGNGNPGGFDLNWKTSPWANTNSYNYGDGVSDGTNAYACIQSTAASPNSQPLSNAAFWELLGADNGLHGGATTAPFSTSANLSQVTSCFVMTAAFADFDNYPAGGTTSDLVALNQFGFHAAFGISAAATDSTQSGSNSYCMAAGVGVVNSAPFSAVFGYGAGTSGGGATDPRLALCRGAMICDTTGIHVSSKNAKLGGCIFDNVVAVASTNATTEQTIYSNSLGLTAIGRGMLDTNGDKIRARYVFTFKNVAQVREFKLYFDNTGATAIYDSGSSVPSAAGELILDVVISRVSATSVAYSVTALSSGFTAAPPAASAGTITGLTTLLSTVTVLKATVTQAVSATAADVSGIIGTAEWIPAA